MNNQDLGSIKVYEAFTELLNNKPAHKGRESFFEITINVADALIRSVPVAYRETMKSDIISYFEQAKEFFEGKKYV